MQFRDRREAGRLLGQKLLQYARSDGPLDEWLVEALPRGGVPVGYEVASAINARLGVFIVRKLGVPGDPELAMGAIASGGACLLNQGVIEDLGIPPELIQAAIDREKSVLKAREAAYGIALNPTDFSGKFVVLVDDGAATGATMRVAIQALRQHNARRILVALPTMATHIARQLRAEADGVVSLIESDLFASVGQWFQNFSQTTDEEVVEYLKKSTNRPLNMGRTL